MALPETCARSGCERLRGRNSAFCDEHHREQLIQADLVRSKPARNLRKSCAAIVQAYERCAISKDESCRALFDVFVDAGVRGFAECWQTGFDSLPGPILADLVAHARRQAAPRLFQPIPTEARRRTEAERRALAVQAQLVQRLEHHMRWSK